LILGANEEAIRVVTIPKNIPIVDPEINELINIYNSSLVYEIKIEFIKSNNTNSLNC
jgi:metal-sulfur cluster biosynthetic enzyme